MDLSSLLPYEVFWSDSLTPLTFLLCLMGLVGGEGLSFFPKWSAVGAEMAPLIWFSSTYRVGLCCGTIC